MKRKSLDPVRELPTLKIASLTGKIDALEFLLKTEKEQCVREQYRIAMLANLLKVHEIDYPMCFSDEEKSHCNRCHRIHFGEPSKPESP